MIVLIAFAFLGGVVTILSPCILPILPVVLSGSVAEGKKRPFGIVTGFILSFTFFTLFLTALVNAFGISADRLRGVSVFVIFLFGISLLIPQVQGIMERGISLFNLKVPKSSGNGFRSGFLIGLSLGLIWTPCVGPILASVISLALTGSVTGSAFLITLAYALGTAVPMFAIMYGGRNLLMKVPALMRNTGRIQKSFGILMILTALAIQFNYDRKFQTYILELFPNYGVGLTSFENADIVQKNLDTMAPTSSRSPEEAFTAPELIPGGAWIHSEPLTLAELRGEKVVLLDFMTYSCINCIRTFPYLNEWWKKYEDDGLVIIGIHTPEFEFEKDVDNVTQALDDFGISFPVMQDNDYATWEAYRNRYWPRKYLIDINGRVIYDHVGEGNYEETERRIQDALKERARVLGESTSLPSGTSELSLEESMTISAVGSPETYFGSLRNSFLGNGTPGVEGRSTFTAPASLKSNTLYLSGSWDIAPEFAQTSSDGSHRILYRYRARNVFLVAASAQPIVATVRRDGVLLTSSRGSDVADDGTITFSDERLYHLIGDTNSGEHTIEIEISEPGLQVFAFTFG